jgi:glycosyltransferase involved in cell wall biosynthesis
MRIGILTSHPIQYQAPLFRALAREFDLTVYFAHRQTSQDQAKAGYGVSFDWDVDLLSGYSSQYLQNRAKQPNVFRFAGCDTPDIAGIIEGGRFDAFIVNGWYLKCYWQAIRACRRHNVPVLVRGDSQLATPRSLLKRAAKEVLYRWVMRQFDGFLYVGKRNLEYLQHYGARPERCFYSPHFIDVDGFREHSRLTLEGRRTVRRGLCAGEDETLLLFVGRLVEVKRPADLIVAAAKLKEQGLAARLVFVGSGPLEARLREQARQMKIEATFAGFKNQTELPPIYAAADLFVLPGEESWGLVVNEAMACGTPAVVSAASGCAPDLIDEESTGKTFATGNPDDLADAIMLMLPKLRSESSLQAIRLKMASYSVANAVAGIHEAIACFRHGEAVDHG